MKAFTIKDFLAVAQRDPQTATWIGHLRDAQYKTGRHVNLFGPSLGQKAYLLAAALEMMQKDSWSFIAADELQLRQWQEQLRAYFPDLLVWRPRDIDLSASEAHSRDLEQERMWVLAQLALQRPVRLLISAPGLLQRLPSPEKVKQNILLVNENHAPSPDALLSFLQHTGYERVEVVENPGQYAKRGDIIDLVPIAASFQLQPLDGGDFPEGLGLRLSYFDDELDGFSCFSLSSQRSVGRQKGSVLLVPAREVLLDLDHAACSARADKILAKGQESLLQLRQNRADSAVVRRLEEGLYREVEQFRNGLHSAPVDKWLPLLFREQTTILDYLQWREGRVEADRLLFVDEPMRLRQSLDTAQAGWEDRVNHGLLKGLHFAFVNQGQVGRAEVMRRLDKEFSIASCATIALAGNGFPAAKEVQISGRESESYRGREKEFLQDFIKRQQATALSAEKDVMYLCFDTELRRAKLEQLLDFFAIRHPRICLLQMPSLRGFYYPDAHVHVVGISEFLAAKSPKRKTKKRSGLPIHFFGDLKVGDFVVHDTHGIAIYQGLSHVEKNGSRRDYLKLSYAKGDELFLPMEALHQLQKYIGASEQKPPKLSRLGGGDWIKLKKRARSSIKKLATDLVALYASRRRLKGHAFQEDTAWEQEFAQRFPYEETEDQLRCIEEIKQDMQAPRVMDRLLCGDVGFGKTEVAFRAIFKAVMGGYQVAFLAPTTVLVRQHYENFCKRLGDVPVRVGHLSRFASEALQKETLSGLRTGRIDVVFGTHRLLSKDIQFKKLGLLIVDEEQRFGVDHKEKIKADYPAVDVLTLSATPIPRTLHMSLSGIRDISVLEEAPIDRRSVMTYVMEYDEDRIKDAILRELSRQGQVFYLFNNTHRIHEKVAQLQEALPGVRIDLAHGKLDEQQLEQVITRFVDGEIDVLVCTTIIESGIDMPNVNTMIIEFADRLGLAQLYQLRGRVGRSGRQAYAYVTYRKEQVLTEVAARRLAAIRDYTELGAGFKIAMRDLEVRGAGNLLGGEQHGQMEAVGYDMYCRMLDEEIRRLRTEAVIEEESLSPDGAVQTSTASGRSAARAFTSSFETANPETVVELPVDAYLSREYIDDEAQRMDMYRRLIGIDTHQEYLDVLDELTDRYGDVPPAVEVLADISYIRQRASLTSITKVSLQGKEVILKLVANRPLNMPAVAALLNAADYPGQLDFHAGSKPFIRCLVEKNHPRQVAAQLRKLFIAAENISLAAEGQT